MKNKTMPPPNPPRDEELSSNLGCEPVIVALFVLITVGFLASFLI